MSTDAGDTTSTGMPPLPTRDALDTTGWGRSATGTALGFVGQGKGQIAASLGGLGDAAREIAAKLEGSGAAPFARYAHGAADTVAGWANTLDSKSVDELADDTRRLVRTNPGLAVGLALAAGFVVARVIKAGGTEVGRGDQY